MTKIELNQVEMPKQDNANKIYKLTNETMLERKNKVLANMKRNKIDTLVIYGDLEHGANFSYLTGFVTRFEEGLLVLHSDGKAYLVLGNENTKMVNYSRIEAEVIHCPFFSLPDQPMEGEKEIVTILEEAGITKSQQIGLAGWKMFTSTKDNSKIFELPYYITKSIEEIVGFENMRNSNDLFMHSDYGARATNNANEIAYFEFGSSLASDCVLETIKQLKVGKSEMEIGQTLVRYGQNPQVVPIAATGDRFEDAYIYPTQKKAKLGDKLSLTTGFKGGLASRSGYLVNTVDELTTDTKDYIDKLARPYFTAIVTWLENMKIGKQGKEIYSLINQVLPKDIYNWTLNPGHLTSDDEWMSSPMKKNSEIVIKSGMMLQTDIIPSIPGYAGTSCENGIAIADKELREDIKEKYPELWTRIENRKEYIKSVLNIELPDEVLPLSSGVGFYTPFFLNPSLAFQKKKSIDK